MRRVGTSLTVLMLATVAVWLAPPPAARAAGHQQVRGTITFTKNHAHPDDSTVSWRLQRWRDGRWRTTDTASWRAGSGMLGKRGRNPCIHNVGWLPNGGYRLRLYLDYPGSLIKGRAFRLDDKRCANGTVRHNLFLHTEQGAHDRQCPDRPGDQPCRWEYPKVDDYKSNGCIKMAPGDLAALVGHFRKAFRPGVRYPRAKVRLVVR
ncbi:MAG: hypothetical protein FWE71_15195 [Nocardioidaceae bacterium]|nr:hypothetical protein [Nocardioidaceae bacterium]MCL2614302.1 hypothetical protein [Nocardioidaceae bacterium]